MEQYEIHEKYLQHEIERFRKFSDKVPRDMYANFWTNMNKLRHNIVVTAAANRLGMDDKEMSLRERLSTICPNINQATENAYYNSLLVLSPDLIKIDNVHMNLYHINMYEVAVSYYRDMVKSRKLKKYADLTNEIQNILKYCGSDIQVECKLHIIIVDQDMTNAKTELDTHIHHRSDDENLEDMLLNLSKRVNKFLMKIKSEYDSYNYDDKVVIRKSLGKNFDEEKEILSELDIDFKRLFAEIKKNSGSRYMEGLPVEKFDEIEDVKLMTDVCLKHLDDYDSKLNSMEKKDVKKAFEHVEGKLKEMSLKEKPSPTFHFMYTPKDPTTKQEHHTYINSFNYVRKIMMNSGSPKSACHYFLRDIFCCQNLGPSLKDSADHTIFFAKGRLKNWNDLIKNRYYVKEPKLFNYRRLSTNAKLFLTKAHVFTKTKNKEITEDPREQETLPIWDANFLKKSSKECGEMGAWFVSKSGWYANVRNESLTQSDPKDRYRSELDDYIDENMGGISQINLKDIKDREGFESKVEEDSLTNASEYCDFVRNISRSICFRPNSSGQGVHVLNVGNRDSWLLTLPGGDLTNKDGDIRFVTMCVVNSDTYNKYKQKSVFNHNLVEHVITVRNKTILVSRWLSLNRNRWEHLMNIDPIPFITLIRHRYSTEKRLSIEDCHFLTFVYMYCAIGCQAKISGLIDNFRYMVPASLSRFSGLDEFIKSKMMVPIKTYGQAYLYDVIKKRILEYNDQRKSIIRNEHIFIDESLDVESSGIKIRATSPFIPGVSVNNRESILSEIYIAFHLTGKGLHNAFMRDIKFCKSIFLGEAEFLDFIKKNLPKSTHSDKTDEFGLPMLYSNIVLQQTRGGLFLKKFIESSSHYATINAKVSQEVLVNLIDKEGLNDSVLTNRQLSSTKSSLTDQMTKDGYPESITLLENSLLKLYSLNREEIDEYIKIMEMNKDIFTNVMNVTNIDVNKNMEEPQEDSDEEILTFEDVDSQKYSSSEYSCDEEGAIIKNEKLAKLIRAKQSINPNALEDLKLPSKVGVISKKKTIGSLSMGINILNKRWPEFKANLKANASDFYDYIKRKLPDQYLYESEFHEGPLRIDSPLRIFLSDPSKESVFKVVAKGQRTMEDREIFVQNDSRYRTYINEHIAKALCKLNDRECISSPGDEKLEKMTNMYERAERWASHKREVDMDWVQRKDEIRRKVYYISGDMTKYSNHDTIMRLFTFVKSMKSNLPKKVYKLLMATMCQEGSKKVYAPVQIIKNLRNEQDAIKKELLKHSVEGNFANLKYNWLQGMRNYLSSLAHYGAHKTIQEIFKNIGGNELYYDFLVHSDDWVAVFGFEYSTKVKNILSYERMITKITNKPVEIWMLDLISMVLKFNNLNVSIKKTYVSRESVEFVSYYCQGGSSYMGGEKQISAIYSEKTELNPAGDIVSLLSSSGAPIMKGVPSSIIDVFRDRALHCLRQDYSMGDSMRFDPCKIYKVNRRLLPLCLLPVLSTTSLIYSITNSVMHDYELISFFLKSLNSIERGFLPEAEVAELKRAISLSMTMSSLYLGRNILLDESTMIIKDESFIKGFDFKPKNLSDIKEKLKVFNIIGVSDIAIDLNALYEFTSKIMAPKDFWTSYALSLHKLKSTEILTKLSSRNRLTSMRARANFKNYDVCKLKCMSIYVSMEEVYNIIKTNMDDYMERKSLVEMKEDLANIKSKFESSFRNFNKLIDWVQSIKVDGYIPKKLNSPKRAVKTIIGSNITRYSNPASDLIVQVMNPDRYELNGVKPVIATELGEDLKLVEQDLKTMGLFGSEKVMDLIQGLDSLVKSATVKRVTNYFLTETPRTPKNLEENIKWLVSRNLTSRYNFHIRSNKLILIDKFLKKDNIARSYCIININTFSEATKFSIKTGVKIKEIVHDNETMNPKDYTRLLIKHCGSQVMSSVNYTKGITPKPVLNKLKFLEYYYLKEHTELENNIDEEHISYYFAKIDEVYRKGSRYIDVDLYMAQKNVVVNFFFKDGLLDIFMNRKHYKASCKIISHFQHKHKNGFQLMEYSLLEYFNHNYSAIKSHLIASSEVLLADKFRFHIKPRDEMNINHYSNICARVFYHSRDSKTKDVRLPPKYRNVMNSIKPEISKTNPLLLINHGAKVASIEGFVPECDFKNYRFEDDINLLDMDNIKKQDMLNNMIYQSELVSFNFNIIDVFDDSIAKYWTRYFNSLTKLQYTLRQYNKTNIDNPKYHNFVQDMNYKYINPSMRFSEKPGTSNLKFAYTEVESDEGSFVEDDDSSEFSLGDDDVDLGLNESNRDFTLNFLKDAIESEDSKLTFVNQIKEVFDYINYTDEGFNWSRNTEIWNDLMELNNYLNSKQNEDIMIEDRIGHYEQTIRTEKANNEKMDDYENDIIEFDGDEEDVLFSDDDVIIESEHEDAQAEEAVFEEEKPKKEMWIDDVEDLPFHMVGDYISADDETDNPSKSDFKEPTYKVIHTKPFTKEHMESYNLEKGVVSYLLSSKFGNPASYYVHTIAMLTNYLYESTHWLDESDLNETLQLKDKKILGILAMYFDDLIAEHADMEGLIIDEELEKYEKQSKKEIFDVIRTDRYPQLYEIIEYVRGALLI